MWPRYSRIKIGYSVPDFRPVCFASAYPLRHLDGSLHRAASICQHRTTDRGRAIASDLGQFA
jgi:hypothetical protein